jgi:hypothetical protein
VHLDRSGDDGVADLLSGESVDNGGGHRCDLQLKIVSRRGRLPEGQPSQNQKEKSKSKSKSGTTKGTTVHEGNRKSVGFPLCTCVPLMVN